MRSDVYERITGQIVAQLEKGVRPWMKPWDAAHAAGPVSKPLRHNGQSYRRAMADHYAKANIMPPERPRLEHRRDGYRWRPP